VCAIGVEQGVILAIVVSILEVIRRLYKPRDFVIGVSGTDHPTFAQATPGAQSAPGLIVFRYDADLFYANVNRFIDDVQKLVENAPDPVRWLVLDAGPIDDVDYSAGVALSGLLDFLDSRGIVLAVARADDSLVETLKHYELLDRIGTDRFYDELTDAVAAFRGSSAGQGPTTAAPA
jgi:MFS superfamily sulfate permease-like transporter